MPFWFGLLIGIFIGFILGIFFVAIMDVYENTQH